LSADGAQIAIIEFETESASRTALLLSNALIGDRPISVNPYTSALEAPDAVVRTAAEHGGDIEAKPQAVPDDQRVSTQHTARRGV
jgi:hypothetical protein